MNPSNKHSDSRNHVKPIVHTIFDASVNGQVMSMEVPASPIIDPAKKSFQKRRDKRSISNPASIGNFGSALKD